ncbi:hypothetical protein QBZ16_003852 [Prototheca wickerhamii]|uniref:Uncharacterized protein n=1 Tax=Prototheca wickerhamii TaxID=3111 RepID=A0AAD9MH49_PROWI|nr:hypothetical protein QBZ16_003852 [Prototheca wickerhamii]
MAGYVGEGLLASAVSGDIFASPSEDAVLAAIRAVAGPAGVLVIVMNYTGDRLNFGAAVERAKAEGLPAEMVIVADDVAPIEGGTRKNARGIAGTVLVHKVAGAAAAAGEPLARVAEAARDRRRRAVPSDRIAPGEMEVGLGIHGEPGALKTKTERLDAVVKRLLECIHDAGPLAPGSPVALLVNNLGGTTPLELSAATASAVRQLRAAPYKVKIERVLSGVFMTSLAMHGLSLTVLRLDDAPGALQALDAPARAPAWPAALAAPGEAEGRATPVTTGATDPPSDEADPEAAKRALAAEPGATVAAALRAARDALAAAQPKLDALDGKVGDGDCGSTLKRGSAAAAAAVEDGTVALQGSLGAAAIGLGRVLGAAMGGTSGAVYKLIFTAAGGALGDDRAVSAASLGAALEAGAAAASKYGGAEEHDRTMLSALWPAARALRDAKGSAGEAAAEATAESGHAGAGRSSYIRSDILKGVPDPGAIGVAEWLEALVPVFEGNPRVHPRREPDPQLAHELLHGAAARFASAHGARARPPTAVLLHGILGSRRNLRPLAERLLAEHPGWRVLLVDLRCHGESSGALRGAPRPPHTVASAAGDVLRLLAHLRLFPEAIIGHSFGAKVAVEMAAQFAKNVAARARAGGAAAARLPHAVQRLAAQGFSAPVAAWAATNLRPRSASDPRGPLVWACDLEGIRELYSSFERCDQRAFACADAGAGGAPHGLRLHYVRAERSAFGWAGEDLGRLRRAGHAVHFLPRAGHWVHTDNPAGLAALMAGPLVAATPQELLVPGGPGTAANILAAGWKGAASMAGAVPV